MDFETAYQLSQQIEQSEPNLTVMGIRRMRREDLNSWAIDVMHNETQKTATVDEKDLWESRVAEIARVDA